MDARSIRAASSEPWRAGKKNGRDRRPAAATGPDRFRVAYEELRGRVLGGAPFGGAFGLVLLLREGLAAWMAGGSVGSVPVAPTVDPDRHAAAPLVPDVIHAAVVRVLASMALGGGAERSA